MIDRLKLIFFLSGLLFTNFVSGKEKKSTENVIRKFRQKEVLYKIAYSVPDGFEKRKGGRLEYKVRFAYPFMTNKLYLVQQEDLFVNAQYPQLAIFAVSFALPHTQKTLNSFEKVIEHNSNVTLLKKEEKIFPSAKKLAYIYHIQHCMPQSCIRKWIAIMGSQAQTSVVSGIYKSNMNEMWKRRLKQVVEHSYISEEIYK